MSEPVMLTVTGDRLMEIRAGLQMLRDRKVELSVDLRVALWWKAIEPVCEAYRSVLAKIEKDELKAQALTDNAERIDAILDAVNRREELVKREFQIPQPKRRLTVGDLPKEVRGEGNEGNEKGRAAIMIALFPEFLELLDSDS